MREYMNTWIHIKKINGLHEFMNIYKLICGYIWIDKLMNDGMKNFNIKGKQEKIRKMEKYEQEGKHMNKEEIEEMRKLEEWTITENKSRRLRKMWHRIYEKKHKESFIHDIRENG